MGVITQNLPYNHSFSIASPCSGVTVETYARIKDVDGITNAIASISAVERIGMDGALYTGNAPQFKDITVVLDLCDERIEWVDVYSFFNRCVTYRLTFDDYYIDAAISQIKRNFFSQESDEMTVVFECATPYWMREFVVSQTIQINGTTPTRFSTPILYGITETVASFTFMVSNLQENTVTGFLLAPADLTENKYVYDVQGMNPVLTPISGATWTFNPNVDDFITSTIEEVSLKKYLASYPDANKRFYLGKDYEMSLYQSVVNTGVIVTIVAKGVIRSYM